MPVKDRAYYLALAEQTIQHQPYDKETEARFRSYMAMAGAAADGHQPKADIATDAFRTFLRTGEVRTGLSGEGPTERNMRLARTCDIYSAVTSDL
jgi:hypothetical protein